MAQTVDSVEIRQWWQTAIIDMEPGRIEFRGHPVAELIGNIGFSQMIWLMIRGEIPCDSQARLLEAALVAAVDHGPQAPSIAAARMAATCGLGLNNVVATGINMLGDVHGGAGEHCAELLLETLQVMENGIRLSSAVSQVLATWQDRRSRIIPGFGHRFHKPTDPRAPRLMELVRAEAAAGTVSGRFVEIGETIQSEVGRYRGEPIAMNIDGATAIIFCELGFPPPLARGLFCLSRSVGILAHGWEQMQRGERNKGPLPPSFLPEYRPE